MKCKKCGQEIKFITNQKIKTVFTVDAQPLEGYKENGKMISGYAEHTCEGLKNGSQSS